jgi:hypothetical protein
MAAREQRPKAKGKVDCFVYVVTDGPTVLYVGKGTGRRHLQSATNHGGTAQIVERFTCEGKAFARERQLISELMPTKNKCLGGNGGRAAPRPKPRKTKWDREIEAIEKMGLRKYAARWLLTNSEAIMRHVPDSKLDVYRLSEVANGCRA